MITTNNNFDRVQRCALVITQKKPFYDWAGMEMHSLDEDLSEPGIYLIPDFEDQAQLRRWVKKNYDLIFKSILSSIYLNEAMWPRNRTYKMFCELVDFSGHLMVWDLE